MGSPRGIIKSFLLASLDGGVSTVEKELREGFNLNRQVTIEIHEAVPARESGAT